MDLKKILDDIAEARRRADEEEDRRLAAEEERLNTRLKALEAQEKRLALKKRVKEKEAEVAKLGGPSTAKQIAKTVWNELFGPEPEQKEKS